MPRRGWKWAVTVIATVLAGLWCGCFESPPTLVVYASTSEEVAEWIGDAFRASHADQVLRVEAVSGPEALNRIRSEASDPVADVWLGAPSWIMANGAAAGLLDGPGPAWRDEVPEDWRDPQGRWTAWVVDPMVLAFNSARIPRNRAPSDWLDVFHPRWTEDVLLPDPRGSDVMAAFIGTNVARRRTSPAEDQPGFDWLARLDAARKGYVTDTDELVRRLSSGEVSLALLPMSVAQAAKERGHAVDFRIPESPAPTLVRGVGIVAGAPHPNAGAAFVTWLGRPETRAALAERFQQVPAVGEPVVGEPSWLGTSRTSLRFDVVPADTLAAHLDGWLARWRDEVMARTTPIL